MGFYGLKMLIIRICTLMLKEEGKEQEGCLLLLLRRHRFRKEISRLAEFDSGFAGGQTAKKKKFKRQQKSNKKGPNKIILMIFTPHLTTLIMNVGGVIDRMTKFNCF